MRIALHLIGDPAHNPGSKQPENPNGCGGSTALSTGWLRRPALYPLSYEGLWIPAVRARDGEVVVFGRDRRDVAVASAVEASSAVPGMFRPKRIEGDDYIDGGAVSPTHAALALDAGGDTVLVSSPMTRPSRTFLARHARRRLREEVKQLRDAGKRVVVVEPTHELMNVAAGFPRRNPGAAPAIEQQAHQDVAAACAKAGI